LIGVSFDVPSLPILHPNRQSIVRESDKILNSSAEAKLTDVVKRTGGRRITTAELVLSYACEAISGELTARLFLLSCIAWILARATGSASLEVPRALLWLAIFLTVAAGAVRYLAWQSYFDRLLRTALGGIWLPNDPSWLVVTRVLLGAVPAGVGFGWLYIRRGLESSMMASLIASAVGYATTTLLLDHLR